MNRCYLITRNVAAGLYGRWCDPDELDDIGCRDEWYLGPQSDVAEVGRVYEVDDEGCILYEAVS